MRKQRHLFYFSAAKEDVHILISGFSLPISEFDTSYRVTNQLVCNGCYNDIRVDWKSGCPYHAGTEREFECSKLISPAMVKDAIGRLIMAEGMR